MTQVSRARLRLEPLISAVFRTYWRFSRGMTLGVRGLVTDAEGRVLLVRHTYKHGWFLPGGGVEHGQTAEDALAMEMAQEAGVYYDARPALLGLYCNHANHRNDHVALYRIAEWRQGPSDSHGEIAEVGFFAPDAPPEGVTAATRRRLNEAFFGAPAQPHW